MTSTATPDIIAPRAKGRPRLTEAADIDRAIREAAMQVLLEHGEAATLNAVAQAAGLSRKSLYARYSSKSALFIDVIRADMANARGIEFSTSGAIEDRLLSDIEAALAAIAKPSARAIQHLLNADPIYIAALRQEMLAATHTIFFKPLLALLHDASASNQLVAIQPDIAARMIVHLIFAEAMFVHKDGQTLFPPTTPTQSARYIADLVLQGLLPRTG